MRLSKTVGVVVVLGFGAAASGDVLFFELDFGWDDFDAAVAGYGYQYVDETYFENAADWGINGIDGPVFWDTQNGYTDGTIPFNLGFDANMTPWGTGGQNSRGPNGLVCVGPSGGFGNPSNALLANYFVDSFDIMVTEGCCKAMAIWTTSLLGSNMGDITVYQDGGAATLFANLPMTPAGNWYGIVITPDQPCIDYVNLYDVAGGAEGVMKVIKWEVPAPGALALLGLAGLVRRRRR